MRLIRLRNNPVRLLPDPALEIVPKRIPTRALLRRSDVVHNKEC